MFSKTNQQQNKKGNPTQPFIQPKLSIGQPGDAYEREADAVAEKVVDSKAGQVSISPMSISPLQRKCNHCEQEEQKVQLKENGENSHSSTLQLESYLNGLNGKGSPLSQETRNYFEPRFGRDFSNVKVHTGHQASESASSIQAHAYTTGNNIVFNKNQYNPNSSSGKKLLAHELTHVVQQGKSHTNINKIQRTIGDGHDLVSPRFSGNLILEAIYDNEQVMQNGSKGTAVSIVQQALLDAGMSLPIFGVDGDFGNETKTAVETFQRASGLEGTDRDGVIGPTTMGWLDQRFATAATPAGTSPGATTGCANYKTVTVDFVSFRGSSRNPGADLDYANTVFNQCCVRFQMGSGASIPDAESDTVLGGDTDLNRSTTCSTNTAEEDNLINNVASGLTSKFKVFYVESISPGARGLSFPPFCGSGAAAAKVNFVYITNTARERSLAHEFGHILLNSGNHPGDTDHLMNPTNTATGESLSDADCVTIFGNA